MIWTAERKIRSPAKAMPSVWKVGKFSLSLLVSCHLVLRSSASKSDARAVSLACCVPAILDRCLAGLAALAVAAPTAARARVSPAIRVRLMVMFIRTSSLLGFLRTW